MKLELFIPDLPAQPAAMLKTQVINLYGGMTAQAATGSWKSLLDGAIITEPIELCTVYTDDAHDMPLQTMLASYKDAAKQEAVMYVLDGQQYFI